MRIDLYGLVHKAQRHHLFGFARELGRADLEDERARAHITARLRDIRDLLIDHAENEQRYIHPLFAELCETSPTSRDEAAATAVASLDSEHHALAEHLDALLSLVESGRWEMLYRATMRFIGEYLLHIDAEERAQIEVLWPSYTDSELGAVFARFEAERAPEAATADLSLMLPALNVPQLATVLRGVQASVPAVALASILELAQNTLGPERWAEVEERLGRESAL